MSFSKDPDLALCEMQHELDERETRLAESLVRIDQLEKALEHFRDLARVSQWEHDQAHIDAPCGDEPCEMQHELDGRGTKLPASARATVPYKFMTMYVTKE